MKNKRKILLLILTISIFSCSKDDGLSSAEIEAMEFLKNNSIKIKNIDSQVFEAIKSSHQLPYDGLNLTTNIEVSTELNFRIINKIEDCNILGNENGRVIYRLSNFYTNELKISDIKLIEREIDEYTVSNSNEIETLYSIYLRGSINPDKWPKVTEYQSDLEFCSFELPEIPDAKNVINTDFIVLSFFSFNEAEIDEYEKHIRVLAGL